LSAVRRDQPTSQRDMTDRTDSGGVSGARGADELAAFCALIDAHATTLTRVAAAMVGASDAEDAAQEAVVRAWRAWPELRDRAAARAWLISITVNVCRDWLRGRFGARLRLTESLSGAGDEPRAIAQLDADPGASDHAAALDLRHAITTLDDDLRVIVALRYYTGMDSTTIGAALGMPAATVRTRLRRALGLLRDQLSGAQPSAPDPTTDAATETNEPEGRR
jgi:RNA polymerase sigma-70 factor (ECF subfamily)